MTAAALLLMLKSIVVASPPQYWQLWHLQNAQDGFLPSADGLQNGWQALYLKSPGFSDEQTAFDIKDRLRRARLAGAHGDAARRSWLAKRTPHRTQRIRWLYAREFEFSVRIVVGTKLLRENCRRARPSIPDAHRGRQAHARLADAVAQHHTEATIISRSTCLRCLRHAGRVCLVTRPWILRSGRSARNDASHQRINLAALRQGRRLIWHT